MENQLVAGKIDPEGEKTAAAKRAVAAVLQKPTNVHAKLEGFHVPLSTFRRGETLRIETGVAPKVTSVRLRFRHVNQGELWQVSDMELKENRYAAVIPGSYTDSDFPLQYHFELHKGSGAWLFPGLSPGWKGQPYFVVHAERS
jgi:hypothetical protein